MLESMTKERAISLLIRYRGEAPSPPKHYCFAKWTMYEFGERVYTRYIVGELIKRIRDAPESVHPLHVVQTFYWWVEDTMIDSQNPITNQFTKIVYRIAADLSEYLWIEEDYERHRGEVEYYYRLKYHHKEGSDVQH